MSLLKRIAAIVVGVIGALGLLGVVMGSDPLQKAVALAAFFLAMIGAAVAIWVSARKSEAQERERTEVQKLLALVGDQGTLAPPQLIAAGYTKEEAEEALKRLRDSGVAQFDIDESGTPVYRVHEAALAARKRKSW